MRALLVGLSALTLAAAAGAAFAQSTPTPDSSAAPMAAMPAKLSVKTSMISDLLANPASKAVVEKDLPGLIADPRLQQAMSMTLTDIEPYSDGKITDAVLAKVQADLDAIPAQ